MRFESKVLQVATSAGAGAAILFERFIEKTVLVGGTFTATVRVQGSIDGTNFVDLTADITTPSIHEIPHTVRYIRVRTVAWTSSPSITLGGFDSRAV